MTLHPFLQLLAEAGVWHPPATNGNGHPAPAWPATPGQGDGTRYGEAALRSEASRVAVTPEGGRNDALNTAAFRLGQLVALDLLGEAEVITALHDAAAACGLGPHEAGATIRSGLAAGREHARTTVDLTGSTALPAAYTLSLEPPTLSVHRLSGAATDEATDAATDATDVPSVFRGQATDGATDATDTGPRAPLPESYPQGQSHTPPEDLLGGRLVPGGTFIHEAPTTVPALWGSSDEVLWARGEPCILTGPTGVGKTTLGGMLVAGRLGLLDTVLDQPVCPGERRTLVLAMDRPAQIQRALARLLRAWPASLLDERLVVWKGPPPADLARHPSMLLQLAQYADADTVIIDSLKDAAVKLSEEETGQGLSRAMNLCVAHGVEVLAYHHQTKRGAGGLGKPNSLADVYGSGWITAGAGSVLLLWGAAGDPVVELSHLKQPAGEIGPLKVIHDHDAGTTSIFRNDTDPFALLSAGPQSAGALATMIYGEKAGDAEVARVRRKLDRLVRDGRARKLSDGPTRGGGDADHQGGSVGTRYALVAPHSVTISSCRATDGATDGFSISAGQATDGSVGAGATDVSTDATDVFPVFAGRATDEATDATDGVATDASPPLLRGEAVAVVVDRCDRCHTKTEHFVPAPNGGEWCRVCAYPDPTTRPGYSEEEKSW